MNELILFGADTGSGSGSIGGENLSQLEQQNAEMEALVGRQAQFDDSVFTHADKPEIITGRIESVRLARGGMLKKRYVEPHWRVSIRTGENNTSEVAFLHVTVLPEDPEEQ